jgi:hypothetical protein
MHEPSWQIACDENGIDANENFHFPFIAGSPEDNQRHEKINAEPGNIHEGGYERSGASGRVESQTAKDEWQHASRQRSKHANSDEARPDRETEQEIVLPVVREV